MPSRRVLSVLAAATLVSVGLASAPAAAHFKLDAPPANLNQDGMGNPQKMGPCGQDGTGVDSGVITTYQAGSTVTITIDETIFHPGHYRVALAVNDPSELPDEPPVTAGATACGSTEIMDPPVFPILADGELVHDAAFGGPQTIQVTLPSDVTCDKCTLQILEFMSSHGAPCFYHHCADIKIQQEPVMTTTSTTSGAGGAGGSTGSNNGGAPGTGAGASAGGADGSGGNGSNLSSTSGCDCSLGGAPDARAGLGVLGLALVAAARAAKRRGAQASRDRRAS